MSYKGPANPLESYAIPDVLQLLYTNGQDAQAILAQLKSMAGVTSGGGGGYPAVFSLPTNYSNLMEILVAGGAAKGQWASDYAVVPANESATLTIEVNPNTVLVFTGNLIDTAIPHDQGFLETITIDGTDLETAAAMLGDINIEGAYVPPAKVSVVFTYQNTTSASITGAYQMQEALVNRNTYTTQLQPTLQAQATRLLQDGAAMMP